MADAFEEFQAAVRANARIHTEADLYWRTNRWAEDGYGTGAVAMKRGEFIVIAAGSGGKSTFLESVYRNDVRDIHDEIERAKTLSSCSTFFKSNKSAPPETGRMYRR